MSTDVSGARGETNENTHSFFYKLTVDFRGNYTLVILFDKSQVTKYLKSDLFEQIYPHTFSTSYFPPKTRPLFVYGGIYLEYVSRHIFQIMLDFNQNIQGFFFVALSFLFFRKASD